MRDGQQRRHVGLEDDVVEEALRGVGERAHEVVAAAQVVAPHRERPHHAGRDHVVELERACRQPLDEELSVLEAGGLAAEADLERDRRHQAEVRRDDDGDLGGGHVAAPGVAVEVAVEDLHLLLELGRRADDREGKEELLPLGRLVFLRRGRQREGSERDDEGRSCDDAHALRRSEHVRGQCRADP
ncbi:MAG TPA: hypothetical protein VIF15_08815 [Polyangiaceae bacterium]